MTGNGVALSTIGFTGVPLDPSVDPNTGLASGSGNRTSGAVPLECNAPANSLGSVPIVAPVTITRQPRVAVSGATATLTAAAVGTPAPTVQWQVSTDGGSTWVDDTTDPGNTTDSLTVPLPTPPQTPSPEYRAVFTNSVANPAGAPPPGAGYSSPYVISSLATNPLVPPPPQAPPVVTSSPSSVTVSAPSAATFTAGASASPVPTVQWQISTDGGSSWTNIAGATASTLTIAPTTTSQSGDEYRAVFANSVGSATTSAATLTVTPSNLPVVTGVTPSSGGPLRLVFVRGANFGRVRGVRFGSTPAFFFELNQSIIIAIVPFDRLAFDKNGKNGVVDVTVSNRFGTSATSSADQYTYTR